MQIISISARIAMKMSTVRIVPSIILISFVSTLVRSWEHAIGNTSPRLFRSSRWLQQ